METCYLCGDSSRVDDPSRHYKVCPMCNVGFCSSCSAAVGNCHLCGAPIGIRTATRQGASYCAVYSPVVYLERRENRRRSYRALTEFVLATSKGRAKWKVPVQAITQDVGPDGLRMYTMMPLRKGQKIMIRQGDIPGGHVLGTVRWVRRVNDRTYTVGIQFPGKAGICGKGTAVRKEKAAAVLHSHN